MHVEPVEIYSDASNAVIMRHTGRRFPVSLSRVTLCQLSAPQRMAFALTAESNSIPTLTRSLMTFKIIFGPS